LALEIRLRPGRVPHRDQDRIRMARGELTKRQNDEILGFPKLDLAARENVKAARVEQAGARARKEERRIDTFMDQRDRLVAQRAQNVCGPVRRAQQTVIRCELLCNFDAGVLENASSDRASPDQTRCRWDEAVPQCVDYHHSALLQVDAARGELLEKAVGS